MRVDFVLCQGATGSSGGNIYRHTDPSDGSLQRFHASLFPFHPVHLSLQKIKKGRDFLSFVFSLKPWFKNWLAQGDGSGPVKKPCFFDEFTKFD